MSRKSKGLSQKQIADYLGYKRNTTISNLESDRAIPDMQALIKIADLLEVDLHWLITGIDPVAKAIEVLAQMDMQQIHNSIADQIDPAIDTPASVEAKLEFVKAIYNLNTGAKGVLEHYKSLIKSDVPAD